MKIKGIILFVILIIPIYSFAEEVYVDNQLSTDCKSGNYSSENRTCSGADGMGFDAIQKGVDYIRKHPRLGSEEFIINVMDGTYTVISPGIMLTDDRSPYKPLRGTAKYPITIRAYNVTWPPSVILRASGSVKAMINVGQGPNLADYPDFVTIDGFEIIGGTTGVGNGSMMHTYDDDIYMTIQNCKIHGQSFTGINGSFTYTIQYNEIYDIGNSSTHHCIYLQGGAENVIIQYNLLHDVVGSGTSFYDNWAEDKAAHPDWDHPDNNIVRFNIFWNTGGPSQGGVLANGSNTQIYNNTFVNTRNGVQLRGPVNSGNVVKNNIFYGGSNCAVAVEGDTGCTIANNYMGWSAKTEVGCIYEFKGGSCTKTDNIVTGDPGFVVTPELSGEMDYRNPITAKWHDFRLKSDSQVIYRGRDLGTESGIDPRDTSWPPSLLDKDIHGSGWSMGAFVYADGTANNSPEAPEAPKGLKILE